jgi:glycosyltransferase involved in cell wall biosynthesis
MKVLLTIFEELYPLSGGGTPRVSNLAQAFARKGHEVGVAAGIGSSDEEARKYLRCGPIWNLRAVSRLDPKKMKKYLIAHPVNIFKLAGAIARYKPDLVVSHNTIAGYGALWGKRLAGKRLAGGSPFLVLDLTDVLFEYLDDYSSGGWLKQVQKGGRMIEGAAIRRSDKIITISRAMKTILLDYGAEAGKVDVVCDGVDLAIFKKLEARDLRAKYAAGRETVVLFQGVIDPQDGPELLVASARAVLAEHPKTSFWVVGGGTAIPTLEKLVREAGVEKDFFFSGWVTQAEVARYLSAGDIGLVILPDIVSARGRVTLKEFEYWACGCSVVAPRLPALEEVIEDGKTGLFYKAGDQNDFAEKIKALIRDPARSRRMGAEGMKLVSEKYRWEKLADDFVSLCEGYLAKR